MTAGIRARRRLLSIGFAALAGCAELPPAPQPAPAPPPPVRPVAQDEQLSRVLARHLQAAQQYRQSGDLSAAATQWQILTVLAPNDETYRTELAAARAAVSRRAQEHLNAGTAALRSGDADRAADAMLRVLALDPDNAEAAQALRDIEKRRLARIQAGRAARVGGEVGGQSARSGVPRTQMAIEPVAGDGYGVDQPLEMFKAGDVEGGLRELRRFVEANPNDRATRNRAGTVVYERARELEGQGEREQAFALYEQAVFLRGEPAAGWSARIQALRKSLGDEYFEKGVKAYPADMPLAITQWEASLRFDPTNAKTAARLKDARLAQDKGARAKN